MYPLGQECPVGAVFQDIPGAMPKHPDGRELADGREYQGGRANREYLHGAVYQDGAE